MSYTCLFSHYKIFKTLIGWETNLELSGKLYEMRLKSIIASSKIRKEKGWNSNRKICRAFTHLFNGSDLRRHRSYKHKSLTRWKRLISIIVDVLVALLLKFHLVDQSSKCCWMLACSNTSVNGPNVIDAASKRSFNEPDRTCQNKNPVLCYPKWPVGNCKNNVIYTTQLSVKKKMVYRYVAFLFYILACMFIVNCFYGFFKLPNSYCS